MADAGASEGHFLGAIVLMIVSALFSWLQGWTGTIIIGVLIALNLISHHSEKFLYGASLRTTRMLGVRDAVPSGTRSRSAS